MKSFRYRLATAAFAAFYGWIALLGPGLHMLAGHGAHVGSQEIECAEHGHSHNVDCDLFDDLFNHAGGGNLGPGGHDHAYARGTHSASEEPVHLSARRCDLFAHDCHICQFLSEVRTAAAPVASVLAHPLLSPETPTIPENVTVSVALGPQAPRGPPLLLA